MKILFLDIDGVLNSRSFLQELDVPKKTIDHIICDKNHNVLQTLFEKHLDLHSVVSSSHRINNDLSALKSNLSGLRVIDAISSDVTQDRGELINEWLSNTNQDIESWAIIDDTPQLILDQQKDRLVSPLLKTGVKPKHVNQLDNILSLS
jgi:hypothetical protein